MLDKFKDECGVFGIFGHPEAANLTYLGLYALQHRGQESAGIATADGVKMHVSRTMGQVADAFTPNVLAGLPGHLAIGHTRYSTAGESRLQNAQPMLIDCAHGQIAVGHRRTHFSQRVPEAGHDALRRVRQGAVEIEDHQLRAGHDGTAQGFCHPSIVADV